MSTWSVTSWSKYTLNKSNYGTKLDENFALRFNFLSESNNAKLCGSTTASTTITSSSSSMTCYYYYYYYYYYYNYYYYYYNYYNYCCLYQTKTLLNLFRSCLPLISRFCE
eukprot:gene10217-biopygen1879